MPSKLRRRDLITYAFLSQGIYGSDDRLTGLLPFFHPIVERLEGEIFDPRILADRVNEAYPWSINTDVAENLIPRFQAAGWLQEIVHYNGDVAYRYLKPDDQTLPHDALVATEEELHEIGDHFLQFALSISPLFSIQHDRDTMEELLLRWLVEKQAFDREMIAQAIQDSSLILRDKHSSEDDLIDENGLFLAEDTYLCARFVDAICNDPTHLHLFDQLVRISAVALVAEVILDTQSPQVTALSFSNGRIFYDSPFLLDLFGCSGHNSRENAAFIHEHLLSLEAIPSAFSHSIDEARDNLKAVLKSPVPERYGPTAESIKKGEVLEDYVTDVLRRIDSYLSVHSVQKVHVDLQLYPNEHRYFDSELRDLLFSQIRWDNTTARERDVDSITYIMRKRRGQGTSDITKSTPILLTKNAPLASIASRFCAREHLITEYDVGPAVHQRQVASIVWMLVGNQGREELARRDLIRRCADVVRCRPDVVAKTREELRRADLEKARQFEALVTRPRPTQLLMDLTLGAKRIVTSENLDVIFERLKDSAAEQAQRKADEEKKQLKDKHRKQRLTWKSQIEIEKKARVATVDELFREEKRRQEADEQLSSMKQRETRMLESWVVASAHYETRANSAIDWLVYGALTAVATAGFVAAIMDIYPYYTSTVGAAATLIGVLIAVGEKTKLMPRVGRRRVFEKKVRFISERAKEAGRDDLLERIMVDHLAMTIGLEDPK